MTYEDFAISNGIAYPQLIRFAEAGRSFDEGVEIKVKDHTLNPPLRDDVFVVVPPPGYPVEAVPCCPGCDEKGGR